MQVAGRPLEVDVSPGDWIGPALRPFDEGVVGSLVPSVFARYARVFHPALRYAGADDVEVSWAEVAAANCTAVHPLMQWPGLTGSWAFLGADNQSPLWDDAPAEGHLPSGTAAALAAVLAAHTTTPDDVRFGLSADLGTGDAPRLALPGRQLWLVRGPIGTAAANLADEPNEQSANLWWPADRAWCVVTDIALTSTYVGGSEACIAAVLAADRLETAPAAPEDPTGPGEDRVNPVID